MTQEKFYYNISDLEEMFGLSAHTIRFWEKEIEYLNPPRLNGIRQYTRKDVERMRTVYHLIKEKGLKIKSVNEHLKTKNVDSVHINAEVVERLEKIKSSLLQTILLLESSSDDILVSDFDDNN